MSKRLIKALALFGFLSCAVFAYAESATTFITNSEISAQQARGASKASEKGAAKVTNRPWWDNYPRVTFAATAAGAQAANANMINVLADHQDEGRGPLSRATEAEINSASVWNAAKAAGLRSTAWLEGFGDTRAFIQGINRPDPNGQPLRFSTDPNFPAQQPALVLANHWTWDFWGLGKKNPTGVPITDIVWAGLQGFMNDDAWVGGFGRTTYDPALPLPAFADGRSALGYNHARSGIASQSSNYPYNGKANGFPALNAIDGDRGETWNFSHTNSEYQPWWQVDLGSPRHITEIRIWNRRDCCQSRLSDYWVFIDPTDCSFDSDRVTVADVSGQQAGFPSVFTLDQTARCIRVQLKGTDYLALAEVEVIGPHADAGGDPRGALLYDAIASKDINGKVKIEYATDGQNVEGKLSVNTGKPNGQSCKTNNECCSDQCASGFCATKTGCEATSDMGWSRDNAVPWWVSYNTDAARYFINQRQLDGFWVDNYTGWNAMGSYPIDRAFGDWSVKLFKDRTGVDIRAYLKQRYCEWSGKCQEPYPLDDSWSDPRFLDDSIWQQYLAFKAQLGHQRAAELYAAVKSAAGSRASDVYIGGNDMPVLTLGAIQGDEVDMVNAEHNPGPNLDVGVVGRGLPPYGRSGSFYATAAAYAKSRHAIIWYYLDDPYKIYRGRPELGRVLGYEALANNTLLNGGIERRLYAGSNGNYTMNYPDDATQPGDVFVRQIYGDDPVYGNETPRVAGNTQSQADVNSTIARLASVFGDRERRGSVAVVYSTHTQHSFLAPGGFPGLTVSNPTYDLNTPRYLDHNLAFTGWTSALEDLHIPYRSVPDFKLNAAALQGVQVLILPHVRAIDQSLIDGVIVPFLNAGGSIIVTGARSGERQGLLGQYAPNPGGAALYNLVRQSAASTGRLFVDGNPGFSYHVAMARGSADVTARSTIKTALDGLQQAGRFAPDVTMNMNSASFVNGTHFVVSAVHHDAIQNIFFVDVANLNINVAKDAVTTAPAIDTTIKVPDTLAGKTLVATFYDASGSQTSLAATAVDGQRVRVQIPSFRYYGTVLVKEGAAAQRTLSVSVTGSGMVSSNPAGINCGATCSAGFASGTVVTLTATPAAGSTFAGWSGACSGTGTCAVTMSAAQSVTATFNAQLNYALTINKGGTGSGSVTSNPAGINCGATCSASYSGGTQVALTASANSGSTFAGWSGACSGTGTCTVTISTAQSVTATFNTQIISGYVGCYTDDGTRALPAMLSAGGETIESCKAKAAAAGYAYAGVQCYGQCWGGNTLGYTKVSDSECNTSCSANQAEMCGGLWRNSVYQTGVTPVTYTLSITRIGNGTITSSPTGINCGSSCSAPYARGTTVTLSAAAISGSTFTGWSGACSGTGTCTIAMNGNVSVTATFNQSGPQITAIRDGISGGTNIYPTTTITIYGSGFSSSGNTVLLQRTGYSNVWLYNGDGHYFWDYNGIQINASLDNRVAAGTWTVTVRNSSGASSAPFSLNIVSNSTTCGNGVCEAGENGANCGQDCCDTQTACNQTRQNQGVYFCRNMYYYDWQTQTASWHGFQWVTANDTTGMCVASWQAQEGAWYQTQYQCGGYTGKCRSVPGGYY